MRVVQFVTVLGTMLGARLLAPIAAVAQTADSLAVAACGHSALLPYPLAENVVLRAPGTSRFAGDYRGTEAVSVALDALCATSTVSGAQAFVALPESTITAMPNTERASGAWALSPPVSGGPSYVPLLGAERGAFVLLRTALEGHRLLAWHEVLVFRLDASQRIQSIELYVEDQRAWDRRFPREDGVSRVSVVTQRNVAEARGRVREARFVAGNADRVVAVIDPPRDPGHAAGCRGTTLVQETIAPSGVVRERTQFVSVPMTVGARE